MINSRLLLVLLALHSVLSLKKDTRLGKKPLLQKPTNCHKLKCPAVERPICTRLVYRNAGNKTLYVVMINECEMNYVKCHKDLEAIIVPMKNCGHEDFLKTGIKRPKRQIEHDYQHLFDQNQKNIQKLVMEHNGEGYVNREQENEKYEDATDLNAPIAIQDPPEYETNAGGPPGLGDYNVKQAEDLGSKSAELIIFGKDIKEIMEKVVKNENVDIEQYYADCPTVCPSRDVMVCAKCQHGVYRTFLTICHMRMFSCRHADEKMQLITRRSCVLSAPYMSEPGMQPRGRVQQPSDDDRVLRFIRCREISAKARQEDSRCKLKDDKDTRLHKETFNIKDDY